MNDTKDKLVEIQQKQLDQLESIYDTLFDVLNDGNHNVFAENIQKRILGILNATSDVIIDIKSELHINKHIKSLDDSIFELSQFGFDMAMIISQVQESFKGFGKIHAENKEEDSIS